MTFKTFAKDKSNLFFKYSFSFYCLCFQALLAYQEALAHSVALVPLVL